MRGRKRESFDRKNRETSRFRLNHCGAEGGKENVAVHRRTPIGGKRKQVPTGQEALFHGSNFKKKSLDWRGTSAKGEAGGDVSLARPTCPAGMKICHGGRKKKTKRPLEFSTAAQGLKI